MSNDDREYAIINQRLVEKGDKERLRAVLREQLIKSGWRDALKLECRKVVQEQGLDNISVDEIIKQVTPHARATIPSDVKQDLLNRIKEIVQNESDSF
ncbi:transcription and mRNA export factor ENY2-like [Daphnia pulex]|uniref:Transcription and mRNA export factor ENY2 n=2 Tax=Daphnia TaxID=6668 RepID=E9HMA1_DAPPU|nr:transcription and mRNA export factor ENY2-like [Daphnia pulex]XP_046637666.1 transcription and mRNA export factor ENY2-like [Daphnia pulicaria]EFX67106.1 hypothetical protein DAPPUDRAFT_302195 [Daphnia pulex]CAH0105560.1 unnamed protein product [Daphnia galeata]|eukprot:EFX67106.1 hypothetical protein DAPPUDRAFT_302195 [Daphnia pulex]